MSKNPSDLVMSKQRTKSREEVAADTKKYVEMRLKDKPPGPVMDDTDRGYHSATDPHPDQTSAELYDQVVQDHLVKRGCWIPSRFKKFPRFTIFT